MPPSAALVRALIRASRYCSTLSSWGWKMAPNLDSFAAMAVYNLMRATAAYELRTKKCVGSDRSDLMSMDRNASKASWVDRKHLVRLSIWMGVTDSGSGGPSMGVEW